MKNKGVIVYALGVGSGADRAELEEIASRIDYVSISPSFKDLLSISSAIRRLFCNVPTPAPPTTTPLPDPCTTEGCNAPYNVGCRVVNNKARCICPTCPTILKPVCASDDVQDLSECHLRQQACGMDIDVNVAKQAPCDKECHAVVDIAFIIDSSGSIGRTNWERMKRFIKALISKLDVSPSATHIAAVAYSTNPKVEMTFNNVQSTNEVVGKVGGMLWQRGFTYTDKALQLADSDLFSGF
ncbi:hypothetical protein OS493_010821 [Desmophyllum pertusum]|uniref:VWFA domain-containing protein n=1 Tax=Desmophyllum pertusum TaxID=174260 RepID=A0A9W9ZEZ9_9CNID|nr:hypothetical protein OS493_010821 [Desmophyllum pertusum]